MAASPPDPLRLDCPPPASAIAYFPPAFGTRFAIFADAEEEFDWSRPFDRAATATTAIRALPQATRRFADRGIVPTYLIDHPVAVAPESAAIVARLAAAELCDIGAQLHPWVTPPDEEDVNSYNSFAGNLPPALEEAKIARLTAAVTAVAGKAPIAFRAGRYGVGLATARLLRHAGYRLDVSTRPGFDYRAGGGPDFRDHPAIPWWSAPDLLEVPLSVAWIGPLRSAAIPPGLEPMAARLRLRHRIALTPEGMRARDVRHAIDRLLRDGHRLFSLSFHTPSLVPGHTPYVRDAGDLRRFWRWWDRVLDHLARRGVTPVRAAEIVEAARWVASDGREPLSPPGACSSRVELAAHNG